MGEGLLTGHGFILEIIGHDFDKMGPYMGWKKKNEQSIKVEKMQEANL